MASTEAALKRWFGMFTSGDLLKVDLIIDITGMKGLSLCWLKMKSKICLSIYTYSSFSAKMFPTLYRRQNKRCMVLISPPTIKCFLFIQISPGNYDEYIIIRVKLNA